MQNMIFKLADSWFRPVNYSPESKIISLLARAENGINYQMSKDEALYKESENFYFLTVNSLEDFERVLMEFSSMTIQYDWDQMIHTITPVKEQENPKKRAEIQTLKGEKLMDVNFDFNIEVQTKDGVLGVRLINPKTDEEFMRIHNSTRIEIKR